MSVCLFIASDIDMLEVQNPHYKLLSVNEAFKLGIEVDVELLDSKIVSIRFSELLQVE